MVSKSYNGQALGGYQNCAKGPIVYWAKMEKERKVPTPYEYADDTDSRSQSHEYCQNEADGVQPNI